MKLIFSLNLLFTSAFLFAQNKIEWEAIYDVPPQGKKGVNGFTKLLKLDSNNAELYWRRGNAFHTIKNYNSAISDFDKSLMKDSSFSHGQVLESRGLSFEMLGFYKEAVLDFTNAIIHANQQDKTIPQGQEKYYYHRGRNKFKLGDTVNAIQDLDSSIKYWSLHFQARQFRAMLYSMIGEYQKSIDDYNFLKYKWRGGWGEFPMKKDYALPYYWRGIAKKHTGDSSYTKDLQIAEKLKYYKINTLKLDEIQQAVYK